MAPTPDTVTVSVPPKPEYVHLVRSVVTATAASTDLPYDTIDDLKLAVGEACARLVALPGGTALTVHVARRPDRIEIVARIDGRSDEWPPPGTVDSLAWQILSKLADEIRFDTVDGGPAIRLWKGTPR